MGGLASGVPVPKLIFVGHKLGSGGACGWTSPSGKGRGSTLSRPVHVVIVVGLAEKETDNGGLGSALCISGVLEDGRFGQNILLEGVKALGVLVM